MSSFDADLLKSQAKETELRTYFLNNGFCEVTTTQDKGLFPDYDLKIQKCDTCPSYTLELKYDRMAPDTGNVAIEIGKVVDGKRKPSGLTATKADIYVYCFPGDSNYYTIMTSTLKYEIFGKKNYHRETQGGDGNRSILVLMKVEKFKSLCSPIDVSQVPQTQKTNIA